MDSEQIGSSQFKGPVVSDASRGVTTPSTTKTIEIKSGSENSGCTVVKRNGILVPFRRDRIFMAIEAALRATHGIPISDPLPQDIYRIAQDITGRVVSESLAQAARGQSLTVEGIQDIVELKLVESGQHDVARNYIIYRDNHKKVREDSPRNLKIFRRDGSVVRFNPMKIASAVERAFRASLQIEGPTPDDVINAVNLITNKVVSESVRQAKQGTVLHIETVQDEVERKLMSEGFYNVAKDFIIYRAMRAADRARYDAQQSVTSEVVESVQTHDKGREFKAVARDGSVVIVKESDIRKKIQFGCRGLEKEVSVEALLEQAVSNFYDGIKLHELDLCNVMAAKARVELEPAYSKVAARLMLDLIYRETVGISGDHPSFIAAHREYFKSYLERAVKIDRIDPKLLEMNLDKLANAIDLGRDDKFGYLGVQTLYDRYLIHEKEVRLETPQIFWMRVAMGLSLNEKKEVREDRAIDFYNVLSQFLFTSSTPTLFNAGTTHSQLSSCYLSTVMDDLGHIFKVISDDAQLSKWAGGLGNDWTNVRATGSRIKGTNGLSQGVIPFLKVANDTAVAVNQGGKRKGAMCAYLETWHLDVEDFLELRKNTGDERRRTHDMNTANWIPDLFMKRVLENGNWTLFSPSDVPDLHDLYGSAFEKRYKEYEAMTERGELKLFKRVEALGLWRKMLGMVFETGHPWITFKDPSNIRSPQDHIGVVHSSNLCTEILLNTSVEETAVCNLGSVNLVSHTTEKGLNEELLASTIRIAVRMLDNVIDINFYPTPEARSANLKHRPIGLGIMGFQEALYIQNISYASNEAVQFADRSMEMISYYTLLASTELAKERGAYASYKGSKWDRGLLPIDTIDLLAKERGSDVDVDRSSTMNWQIVRDAIKRHGMRNSNTMAIAPTATISNITGVSQSIEPMYKHLFVKSNLSGEFTVPNPYLVERLKALGIWDAEMVDDLKYFDGSIMEIERIPDEVKAVYPTAFEIEPEWLIECGSRRQKWIDMGQSLNLYIYEPSGKKLHSMYIMAWQKGLKTTYYLRSLGATQIEKSTTDINKRGLQPRWMKNKSASSNISVARDDSAAAAAPAVTEDKAARVTKGAPVCNMEEGCESCQ